MPQEYLLPIGPFVLNDKPLLGRVQDVVVTRSVEQVHAWSTGRVWNSVHNDTSSFTLQRMELIIILLKKTTNAVEICDADVDAKGLRQCPMSHETAMLL